jgi:pyruvate/2-oxoglutarate dehydrogenase complex dihydrolipoamide dehydrogenase (E3) component
MSTETFDAVVVGAGPGGEVAADRLIKAGRKVALVERELLGGECAYWACIPSKTLLRPTEARAEAARAAGSSEPSLDFPDAAAYRDTMVRQRDDSRQLASYEEMGATVVRGVGRLDGPGVVRVEGRELRARDIVVATGSDASIPPIEGLDSATVWTNREATTLSELPRRVVFVGGGPVAVELGQMMARFGAQVALVHRRDHLVNREDPRVGELIAEALGDDGIALHLGRRAERVRPDGDGSVLILDDGTEIGTDVIVISAGRKPRLQDIGLETVGLDPDKRLPLDDRCSFGEGLWAVGDVTSKLLFTHLAKYQGRVVAANILGHERHAHYRGVPRVVFSDPEIAAVGLTAAQAGEEEIDVAAVELDLAATISRPVTYEQDPRASLALVADRSRRVLVGAWAVSPMAGEWIHQVADAVRLEIPIDALLDGVPQFPTYCEGFLAALEALEL